MLEQLILEMFVPDTTQVRRGFVSSFTNWMRGGDSKGQVEMAASIA